MKTKNKKSIQNFIAELTLCLFSTALILIFSAPLTNAYFENNENKIYISQVGTGSGGTTATTPATTSGVGSGSGSTQTTPGIGTGSGSSTPTQSTTTPAQGNVYGPENPLIPLSTNYSSEIPQLNTSGGFIGMLNTFVGGIFQNLKYILGTIAVLYIILAAVKMIIAGDSEEVVGNQKKALTYGIIGLAVVGLSSELARVFTVACPAGQPDCIKGGFLSQPAAMIQSAGIFTLEVRIFITFIKYLIGGIAVLMLIRNGVRLIALQGKEETVTLDKKNIAFTSVALILIIIASTLIDKVLYIVDTTRYQVGGVQPAINVERGMQEIVGATNLIVTFVAPLAVIVLIIGAVMYATAGGKEETMTKAKRMITMAIIGMVLIFGAFAIVSTIISGQFNP